MKIIIFVALLIAAHGILEECDDYGNYSKWYWEQVTDGAETEYRLVYCIRVEGMPQIPVFIELN